MRSPLLLLATLLACFATAAAAPLELPMRQRVKDGDAWTIAEKAVEWDPAKTALVICDMWDTHTCPNAAARVAELAPRVNAFAKAARERGVLIIHAPSDVTKFYEDTPQRKLAKAAPEVEPKVPLKRWCALDPEREAPLPIDDSDGGCDGITTWKKGDPYPWTRQHPAIEIMEGDAITDSAEAYYLMRQRGIENVLVCGVHLNMCVLGRPFAIRQLVAQELNVALVRDLTDSMYNPQRRPWVTHFDGTRLMIEHVEKYWCSSTTSDALLGDGEFKFAGDRPPHIVFLIGENEYRTAETVPTWARRELEPHGVRCSFFIDDGDEEPSFPQLANLGKADALFVSLRRRGLPADQLQQIRDFVKAGKPVLGIRTASHAFAPKKLAAGQADWTTFDRDVFGGVYENHYGKGPAIIASIAPVNAEHPVLRGIPTGPLRFASHLYKCRNLAPTTTLLLSATLQTQPDVREPIAWINVDGERKAFYTSLGSPEDFAQPVFRRLLVNASLWAVALPIVPPEAEVAAVAKPAAQ